MVYPITKRIIKILLNPFIKKVEGTANVPDGGFLIVANHKSNLDQFLIFDTVIWKTNRKIHFMAGENLFRNPIRRMIWERWAGCIPVSYKGKTDISKAVKIIKEGGIVAIYPEGRVADEKKITKGKTGAVRIALASKAHILPIGLKNVGYIMPKDRFRPVRYKKLIEIRIGKIIDLKEYNNKKITHRLLQSITDKLMKQMAKLSGMAY